MSTEFLFHPAFVHFPIAFYALELFLLVLWFKKNDDQYCRFALLTFKLGFILMLAAMVAGLVDAGGWSNVRGPVRRHFYAAMAVLVIYTLRAFYWKMASSEDERFRVVQIGGAALGNMAVAYASFLGGELVYE